MRWEVATCVTILVIFSLEPTFFSYQLNNFDLGKKSQLSLTGKYKNTSCCTCGESMPKLINLTDFLFTRTKKLYYLIRFLAFVVANSLWGIKESNCIVYRLSISRYQNRTIQYFINFLYEKLIIRYFKAANKLFLVTAICWTATAVKILQFKSRIIYTLSPAPCFQNTWLEHLF